MRDQPVDERLDPGAELGWLRPELRQRLGKSVRDLDLPAAQCPQQLALVVAWHAQRGAVADHSHDQAKHARRVRASVDEVTHVDGPAAGRMTRASRAACLVAADLVAEVGQERR